MSTSQTTRGFRQKQTPTEVEPSSFRVWHTHPPSRACIGRGGNQGSTVPTRHPHVVASSPFMERGGIIRYINNSSQRVVFKRRMYFAVHLLPTGSRPVFRMFQRCADTKYLHNPHPSCLSVQQTPKHIHTVLGIYRSKALL